MISHSTSEPDTGDQAALRSALDGALDHLPERYRIPLVLHYLEGRSQAEVATTLGMSVGTLTSFLSRGREMLRQRLRRRGTVVPLTLLATFLGGEAAAAEPCAFQTVADAVLSGAPITPAASALAKEHLRSTALAALQVLALQALVLASGITLVAALWWGSAQPPAASTAHEPPRVASNPNPPVMVAPIVALEPVMDDHDRRTFATFPEAVQHSLVRLAEGKRVRDCEVELENGRTTYHADILLGTGNKVEYTLAEDGSVIAQITEADDEHELRDPERAQTASDQVF